MANRWTNVTGEMDGNKYQVVVKDKNGLSTPSNPATLTVNKKPVIVSHPEDRAVNPGADVHFSVTATGTEPLTYQWQRNTGSGFSDIVGEINDTLTLNKVTSEMDGYQYRVVVKDSIGLSRVSNAATLTINEAPKIIVQPEKVTVNPGNSAGFNVTATGSEPLMYQWQVDSGDGFHDIDDETDATLTLHSVTTAMNGYKYRVVVTDNNGLSTISMEAALTVNIRPLPSTIAPSMPAPTGVEVLVNGKAERAGTAVEEEVNGQQVTTILVDEENLQKRLEVEGHQAIVTILALTDSDIVVG